MGTILFIILIFLIVALCCLIAIGNLIRRHREPEKQVISLENLDILKQQGMITDEEFESIKDGAQKPQDLAVESCTFSAEEVTDAVESALRIFDELTADARYTGSSSWAKIFGVQSDLNLTLRELTLLGMKIVKPRPAIEVITEVLAINIPIDAVEAVQKKGEVALPHYRATARTIWVQAIQHLSEPISVQKEMQKQRKISDQALLAKLVPIVMRSLNISISAAGFAAILALMIAKIEFNAYSDEDE